MGGGSEVAAMGWQAKGGLHLPLGHRQWCCVFTIHRIDRGGC